MTERDAIRPHVPRDVQATEHGSQPGPPMAAQQAPAAPVIPEAPTTPEVPGHRLTEEPRLRIAQLLLTSRFAGSERYVVELANEQAKRHDVSVILSARGAESRPDAIAHRLDPRVRIIKIPSWGPLRNLMARRAVHRLAPDVAHAHLSNATKALHRLRRPTLRVSTLHIHYKPSQHRGLDALIAIAPWQLGQIPDTQREYARQITNWTCAPPMDRQARRRLRHQLGIRDDEFLIGALGRTVRQKGMDILVDAWTRTTLPNTRLAVVGSGKEWRTLRRCAPADVIMPGFTDRPHDWFSAFDAYVSPARSEPFGLVFLEAMTAGLPVLATATNGAQYLLPLLGRPLTPLDNVAAMAEALGQLAAERPQRRTYDLHEFQLGTQARKIEDFYRDGLARQRAQRG